MASKECYHFTKLNRVYRIERNGLVPRLEANSKVVNDSSSKISFSDGGIAAAGLFANFYDVYMAMNEGKRNPTDKKVISSKDIEDYLGEGIYLVFDGTNMENTGGNQGHINPFDAATKTSIPPERLKVCVLRDTDGNIHYSQYDYIKYIIANLTKEDYSELQQMDENGVILECIEEYKRAYKDELEQYSREEYNPELMTLDDFSKVYKAEIDANITKYLQTHFIDTQEEIKKISKEFENMPESIKEMLSNCQIQYKQMMEELINGDLSEVEIPIPSFYELYKSDLDSLISQHCNLIVESSREEIAELRQDVESMTEYKELFLHSNHHIKNVVEFAYIIGKSENTLGDDLELLIQAAKCHDSGREESEWLSDNHADPSAEHADIELSKTGKYTPEQIAMIKVAIRYHEHGEKFKNEFDEKYFMELAKADGVPEDKLENTRLMCIYLKDADALDRVRLGNLDISYLRTSVAKSDIFLREFGKDKDSISWEDAGLAIKLNKDFNIEQELLKALQKLKEDYSEKETILRAIENIESYKNDRVTERKNRNIFGMIKKIRHILQIEKIVETVSANTDGILTSPERKEQYMKLAVERFSKSNLDILKLRLADVVRLSEISRKTQQENVSTASIVDEIEDISVGMNDNKKVQFADEQHAIHTGYFKENIIPTFNDASLVMKKIGNLLGVNVAKTYACEYQGKSGIISQDVAEGFDRFMMMREIIKKSELPKIDFSNAERTKATEYNPKGMVTSSKEIKEMFELPLHALEVIGVSQEDIQEITKNYVKMICFDYLTNQTDRNDGNYGILIKDGKASFAPLIDCDYILHDPTDEDNDINFTSSTRCDRDVLMNIVASKYPELVEEFSELVINNQSEISKAISESFSPEMQAKYGSIVEHNISKLQEFSELTKHYKSKPIQKLVQESINGVPDFTSLDKIEHVQARQQKAITEQREGQ